MFEPGLVSRLVASMPSIAGMRMSIRTTCGRVRRDRWTASTPSPASATTSMSSWASTIMRNPAASGEFRHRTATATYLGIPARARVLVAKAIAAALFGLLFGLVGATVASGVGLAFVAASGYEVTVAGATIARYAAGAVLGTGLLAAVGVGVGSLVRAQVGAVVTVFVWGFVVEELLAGQFDGLAPYLPFTAATTMAGATLGGGVDPLPFAAAAALVAGAAALLSVVAARTTVRSD